MQFQRRRTVIGVPGGYARGEARQLDLEHLRSHPMVWLRIAAALVLGGVAMRCLFVLAGQPGGDFAAGVYAGAVGVAVMYDVRAMSGSLPIHRGAVAEQLVDEILRESVPKGWHVRSAISFADGDIDHVIIGDTMVIMVETKSTGTNWHFTDTGITLNGTDPTVRARRSLGRVRRLVTGGASTGIDGQAWLILQSPPNPARDAVLPVLRGEVHILKTRHLADLAAELPPIADLDRVAANVARIDKLITDRRTHEARRLEALATQ